MDLTFSVDKSTYQPIWDGFGRFMQTIGNSTSVRTHSATMQILHIHSHSLGICTPLILSTALLPVTAVVALSTQECTCSAACYVTRVHPY